MRTSRLATINDLYRVEGQAELIGGRIVRLPLHDFLTGRIVMEIASSLYAFSEEFGRGEAFTSTLAYAVPRLPSGRESFCPDVSYHLGPFPENPMAFIDGAPTFAVEVRCVSEVDPAAKRADYFAAGTLVVWDVDPEAEVVRVYRAGEPDRPASYGRGEAAEAEPALPGWRVEVDRVFGAG